MAAGARGATRVAKSLVSLFGAIRAASPSKISILRVPTGWRAVLPVLLEKTREKGATAVA